ncbi:structural maintenance of chromosomes protein 2 [Tanacetum coccineum]
MVDNENTSKQIIENRDLRGRGGEGNVEVVLLLVGYADEVKKAMEFVFGETSVCKTNAAAEKVAFDRNVKTRSDTLEGDLFQPGGLVTGGFVRFAAPSLLGESGHLEIGSIREVNVSPSDTSDNLRNGCRMAMCRDDMNSNDSEYKILKVQGIPACRSNYSKESLAGCESYISWMNNGHVSVQEPSKVKLDSGDVNNNDLTWNHIELSMMLEHVHAHVAPTVVDPGAGLQLLPNIRRSSLESQAY